MPDQPPDPLHYEMKLPPEPKRTKKPGDPSQKPEDDSQQSGKPTDVDKDRDDDKPYTDRRPG